MISERLGHSNIKITLDTYSHVLPTMQEDAVNKIEEIFVGSVTNSVTTGVFEYESKQIKPHQMLI